MTDAVDKRASTARQQILRAASRQFVHRPYDRVGLDEILEEAELTKGAMYFHFGSKHALALAVIEDQTSKYVAAAKELLARRLSGLETLVEATYLVAARDITKDPATAGLHLLESAPQIEGLQTELLGRWIQWFGSLVERAIDEGDIMQQRDPGELARLFVAAYLGMRQTNDLDKAEEFLHDMEKMWILVLSGVLRPERADYFRQFIKRRTALAIKTASASYDSD